MPLADIFARIAAELEQQPGDPRVVVGARPAGLAVALKHIQGEEVEPVYTYVMPPITPDNVDQYIANVVTEKDAFLETLPELIEANLESGDIANEEL